MTHATYYINCLTEYIIEHISLGLHERPSNLNLDKILTLKKRAIKTMLKLKLLNKYLNWYRNVNRIRVNILEYIMYVNSNEWKFLCHTLRCTHTFHTRNTDFFNYRYTYFRTIQKNRPLMLALTFWDIFPRQLRTLMILRYLNFNWIHCLPIEPYI